MAVSPYLYGSGLPQPYVRPTGRVAGGYGGLPYSGYGGQTTGQVVQAARPAAGNAIGGTNTPAPGANAAGTYLPGTSGGSLPAWNPASDPIVQGVTGQSNLTIAQAKARLLRMQKETLIGFGSSNLARTVLGKKDPLLNTISSDPDRSFSYLANLKRDYGVPIQNEANWTGASQFGLIPQAEYGMNADNLWFSSGHADTLRMLEQQKLQARDTEQRRVQGLLGGYQDDYLSSVTAAKNAIQNAILQRQATLAMAGLGGSSY